MIGLLILEPGTKEQQKKKQRLERRRMSKVRQMARDSWTVQPERLDNQVSGNQAKQLDNNVYRKL